MHGQKLGINDTQMFIICYRREYSLFDVNCMYDDGPLNDKMTLTAIEVMNIISIIYHHII